MMLPYSEMLFENDSGQAIGRINSSKGVISITSSSTGMKSEKSEFYHKDWLETSERSVIEATLFLGETEFRVLENSKIKVDQSRYHGDYIILQVIHGDVRILSSEDGSKIRVFKNGRFFNFDTFRKKKKPNKNNDTSTYKAKIRNTMQASSKALRRCYATLLKKQIKVSSQVQIYFEIHPRGHTKNVRVQKSNIREKDFESCLVQIIRRKKFPTFRGTHKKIVYPLVFDQI